MLIMSADYEQEETAEILQVAAIAVRALSVLSTFENEIKHSQEHKTRIPRHNSVLSGQQYTNELLASQSEIRITECLHMPLAVFTLICNHMRKKNLLNDTTYTTVEHRMHIFLYITTTGASNRAAQERFQHSPESISRIFKTVLLAINTMAPEFMQTPTPNNTNLDLVLPEIQQNPKFFPFFKNCLGAIDGSLIPVYVAQKDAPVHRTRKGFTAQNVFIACSFDCTIQFSLAGWEGSAHDNTVLADGMGKGFQVPAGKYYLADAGYGITPQFLTPYRGIRYHLREQVVSNQA